MQQHARPQRITLWFSRVSAPALAAAVCSVAVLGGCYRPHGALISYTGGAQTYYSTETSPKTIVLVDTRNEEVLFEIDIPPGQQFTYDFVEEGSGDAMYPSVMRYDLMPLGTRYGKLDSKRLVPNRFSRRVDFYIRDGVEYAPEPDAYRLRTDQNAPEWWTPEGGPMPDEDAKTTLYDD